MISETTYSNQRKLLRLSLDKAEHKTGNQNLTPDPKSAWWAWGSELKFHQIIKNLLTKVVM